MVKKTERLLGFSQGSFGENDDFILNYRPSIDFVEPFQAPAEPVIPDTTPTLDSAKSQTQQLIDNLNQVAALADAVQKRIDTRVVSGGGLEIKLDPIKDQATIAAMKRRFPDKIDPTSISYEDYRNALNCLQKAAPIPPSFSLSDIQNAKSDPLRTDFGGYSNQQGQNRPEISSPANSVQPLDTDAFQKAAVIALFALLLPLIQVENKLTIAEHIATIPHGI